MPRISHVACWNASVDAPDGQHVGGVAAPYPDDVLRQQIAADIRFGAVKQSQVSALAPLRWDPAVHVDQRLAGVSRRRGDEGHPRAGLAGQAQEIVHDRVGSPRHRPQAAKRNNVSLDHVCCFLDPVRINWSRSPEGEADAVAPGGEEDG
jgi:hypothetical protein